MKTEGTQEVPSNKKGNAYSGWFTAVVALFITCLITANIISVKLIIIFGMVMPAGIIIFPLSYIIGDVLTEVYGYSAARRAIWLGFICNLITVIAISAAQAIPPAPFWQHQSEYNAILGYAPRLLAASFLAYLIGEFLNAYVLSRMKTVTRGRWLWARTITSTIVGQGMDSLVFITIAFAGRMSWASLAMAIIVQWVSKSVYEATATPLTYAAVIFLKKREMLDVYDDHIGFNPFKI